MRKLMVAIAFALFAADAAAQQADPPPPASLDDAGVRAWMDANLQIEGWTVIGADGVAVSLGGPDGVAVLQDGTLQATIRHEYFGAQDMGGQQVRSTVLTQNLDCAQHRYRVTAMSIYEHNNMQGAHQSRQMDNAAWRTPDEHSLTERAFQRVCSAPSTGQRRQ